MEQYLFLLFAVMCADKYDKADQIKCHQEWIECFENKKWYAIKNGELNNDETFIRECMIGLK